MKLVQKRMYFSAFSLSGKDEVSVDSAPCLSSAAVRLMSLHLSTTIPFTISAALLCEHPSRLLIRCTRFTSPVSNSCDTVIK
jgi:hypothetical protein